MKPVVLLRLLTTIFPALLPFQHTHKIDYTFINYFGKYGDLTDEKIWDEVFLNVFFI
ncbi:hypothetical protein M8C21_022792 [Ambrosia artemisiifolia]|uniref:Uncharacterized protein n=1 Tax=Ambrosia artemisiifolia TaxID=4212 RepID=A0AAD5CAM2_AMBAR|nr:hypothetical protein M8C21_022792 [Ambrosia artemisiifolia]